MGSLDYINKEEMVTEDVGFEDYDEDNREIIKFSKYFKPLAMMMIKVMANEKTVLVFPMLKHSKIVKYKKTDKFLCLDETSQVIAKLSNNKLTQISKKLSTSIIYNDGDWLDILIKSFLKDMKQEFYLSSENCKKTFVMAYGIH